MNIIVTGATGFLGTVLCSKLEKEGHAITRLNSNNCDLTLPDSLAKFNNHKYDQIIHLAVWTQAGDFALYHSGEQWLINQKINTNVLDWWHSNQPQAKLISMGTSCTYSPRLDLVEDNYFVGKPIESLFTYAMTKRMLYAGQLAMQKQYGLKHLTFVPSTLYGPGYHTDGRQMHFIFDLIRKIIRGKYYDEPVILWGDGYQRRELVFIDDFVQIMLELIPKLDNELINIGAGVEYTMRHFAEIICEYVGYDATLIQYDTDRYVGAKSKCLDTTKLRKIMPNLSLTKLENGLEQTVEWFMKNRHKILIQGEH